MEGQFSQESSFNKSKSDHSTVLEIENEVFDIYRALSQPGDNSSGKKKWYCFPLSANEH
jgi:hypothetical protein